MGLRGRDSGAGPLLRVLSDVLRIAEAVHARVAVAGGLAQQVWGRIRATRDIDLLVAAPDRGAFLDALAANGFRRSGNPTTLCDVDLVTYSREESFADVEVDLLLVEKGLGESAVSRAVTLDIAGTKAPFVTAEDLILLKLLADRLLDRADVAEIVREQSGRLDLAYLRGEAAVLGISGELEHALKGS